MKSESYVQSLLMSRRLRASIIPEMVRALQLSPGSQGLDAGCGIGLECLVLSEAVGPSGHVTGLDIATEHLKYGLNLVKQAGLSELISFREGDITNLPFGDNTFDWAWSVDCAGFIPPEPLSSLRELVRVVKPGGTIAVASWSSEKLLPGYPDLEARLGATSSGLAPFVKGARPESHFIGGLGWFHELGLLEATAQVFADSFHAPLSNDIRNALFDLFGQRWPDVAGELSPDDLAKFHRLCLSDSPDFILNQSDYYAFFTYSMFQGRVSV